MYTRARLCTAPRRTPPNSAPARRAATVAAAGTTMAAVVRLLLLCALLLAPLPALGGEPSSYVVYLGDHGHSAALGTHGAEELAALERDATDAHYGLLAGVLGDKEKAREAIFYSYTKHINGFAANLDAATAAEIAKQPGVMSVFPNRGRKLHTTRSWQFLGLAGPGGVPRGSAWRKARFGEDTIIGNFDTGVWPESESFRDDGLGPIPSQWKGTCDKGQDDKFNCNRKLIGARYFNKGYASAVGAFNASMYAAPRDMDGHGTHTLSTAGGSPVPGAAVFGFGNGTASGGSPRARVAAYRVCFPPVNGSGCFDADILAAFDAAIHDGVHVLSLSLGGDPSDYFNDGIAIGSFHAVRRGIPVVCSAGNSGPGLGTVSNVAPWIFTTGASTMDREFPSYIVFDQAKAKGQSLSVMALPEKTSYPLIDSAQAAAANATEKDAQLCMVGSLDPEKVKGKIVVCLRGINARVEKGEAVRQAGGVGMVLANDASTGNEIIADAHVLPATHIKYSDGLLLYSYIKSTKTPTGFITKPATILGTKPAPFMAAFSSQGPNTVTPEILKPDITAPGVSVIAAWTGANSPTDLAFDLRRVAFNSESGTSMSCPHVSGIVGLLRTLHPDWSPAAIKSAIMTTAMETDNKGELIMNSSFLPASPFGYGAGHVSPVRAMNPGLVYDLSDADYLDFLCALRYNATMMAMFNGAPYTCPGEAPRSITDLNYPSITIVNVTAAGATARRRVKNVGLPGTYKAFVTEPAGVAATVTPSVLHFGAKGEEKGFEVKFQVKNATLAKDYSFGALVWTNGKHFVRSPLVVKALA
ncbi:subtilisin-like protease SBT5.3 isoform X2 [Phragmites australis]|uniref:subtilisin-like protease SBT5.3 isoform X2 n=1 Tax=Phragmites australis TaxID=29695 RepID=UPI002D77F9FE|nr:subtilisin-like protease SBT5.3 isoform X2 [Phragmites australis]